MDGNDKKSVEDLSQRQKTPESWAPPSTDEAKAGRIANSRPTLVTWQDPVFKNPEENTIHLKLNFLRLGTTYI